ncbi:alpha/beta hydrolase fold [Chloroherpeton thalassium ATCC 35110]|uniref:Alpha/beta hydrolase fold n=1 Tax=Chloroherpeton thalassium (strain ATCC 35110 / GB-78) TaxID=517418 RepID=B3QSS4_CHLT3|nr:alpha/beta hydrolase [Chloroherpeton thalassium]ACF14121.1 alpha/beta hydrolase fold [Chloroherpeton thalassium ATCC 35110]
MSAGQVKPTAKFESYRLDIEKRLKASNKRVKEYAAYQKKLIEQSCFIELNGTVHHYHDSGPRDAKDVVVLIHGWDCWWMWWHKVIGVLNEQGIRTIAYDLKGHGWSDDDHVEDYSLSSYSKDLRCFVSALGLTRYHIAAFSLGPFIALDYAMQYEQDIATMTFFNFGYFPNSPFLSKFIPIFLPLVFDKVLRKIKWWPPLYLYARITLARNPATREDIIIGVDSLKFISSEAIRQTAEQISQIEVTENLPTQVAQIKTPILFVAGKGDQVVMWKNTQKLYEFAANGRFVVIKKCGHLITIELPQRTAELIAENILFNAQSQASSNNESSHGERNPVAKL